MGSRDLDLTHRLAQGLGALALRALDLEVVGSGAHHVPRTGPVLLASNHVSYPDFVFVQAGARSCGRRVRFMCRHDVWDRWPLARAMDAMQHVPVDRAAPAAAYLEARRLLRSGEAVCAFPEAGVSHSFTVRPLMRGVASLARETGAPVVPVALWGPQRIWSVGPLDERGRMPGPDWTRGRRVDVAYGEPFRVDADSDLTEVTVDLGHRITHLLEELQRLPHHRPAEGERAPWYPAHLGGHAPTRSAARHLDVVPRAAVLPVWGPQA